MSEAKKTENSTTENILDPKYGADQLTKMTEFFKDMAKKNDSQWFSCTVGTDPGLVQGGPNGSVDGQKIHDNGTESVRITSPFTVNNTTPFTMPKVEDMVKPGEGVKYDGGKLRLDLLPIEPLEEIAKVLAFGGAKYGDQNWRGGLKYSRLIAAGLRHFYSWIKGENVDPETGLSHLAHLGCCVLFLLWMEKFKPTLDDRYKEAK